MTKSLVPDFLPALRELEALRLKSLDLPEALDELVKAGLPLLVCEIDCLATVATGNLVFAYKVSDHLQVCFETVRARKINSEGLGVDHGCLSHNQLV
jgi:adenine/guanine phosphoribosyltransferase-like PRPP-binding protein